MKTYAFFTEYNLSGKLWNALGDRSVIVIDGRLSNPAKSAVARETALKRGYAGYRLMRGDSILRCHEYESVTFFEPDMVSELKAIA